MPSEPIDDCRALSVQARLLLRRRVEMIRALKGCVDDSRARLAASGRLLVETRCFSPSGDPPPPRSHR